MSEPAKTTVLRIGHRGAAGYEPENTLAAIEKGIALGSDYVEFDVQKTSDGHLIVIHDKRVDRTTNGQGNVSQLSLDQLRGLDAGAGLQVPLLSEVLALVNGRSGLMIELIAPGIAEDVVSAVHNAGTTGPVLYASFLHPELLAVRSTEPCSKTLALMEGEPISGARFAIEAQASHVGLAFESVRPKFVRALQAHNLQVFVYTLNDLRDIANAKELGVNGIISDYPDRI